MWTKYTGWSEGAKVDKRPQGLGGDGQHFHLVPTPFLSSIAWFSVYGTARSSGRTWMLMS